MIEIVSELLMRIFALKSEQLATHQRDDFCKMKKKVCEKRYMFAVLINSKLKKNSIINTIELCSFAMLTQYYCIIERLHLMHNNFWHKTQKHFLSTKFFVIVTCVAVYLSQCLVFIFCIAIYSTYDCIAKKNILKIAHVAKLLVW